MSLLLIRVRFPDGREDSLSIDADRAVIGCGAHCEIRLPVGHAQVEHVIIQVTPAGAFAQALAFDPAPLLNGVPFTQGTLLPDTPLAIGETQIFVQLDDARVRAGGGGAGKQGTSPMTLVLAALMIPLGAFVLLYDDTTEATIRPPKEAPQLWSAAVATCPQTGQAPALSLAMERQALADAKRERSPFDVRDGISAVPLFETASACFKVAGEARASDEARGAAAALRKRFTEEYRMHSVWLERSLRISDWRSAQREVSLLLYFTEGRKGEYVTWLADLDRQLRVKFGQRTP